MTILFLVLTAARTVDMVMSASCADLSWCCLSASVCSFFWQLVQVKVKAKKKKWFVFKYVLLFCPHRQEWPHLSQTGFLRSPEKGRRAQRIRLDLNLRTVKVVQVIFLTELPFIWPHLWHNNFVLKCLNSEHCILFFQLSGSLQSCSILLWHLRTWGEMRRP